MYKILKHNRGQKIFVSMMVSIMVLILVIILSNPLKQEISKSINGTYSGNLSTSNADISIPNRAALVVLDLGLFYFISVLIAISIAYVSGKKSFVGVISSIMIFMVVTILITPLKTLIVLARDSSHLDCSNAAITVGNRLACIFTSIWLFYFVIVCIASAVTAIFLVKVIKK